MRTILPAVEIASVTSIFTCRETVTCLEELSKSCT